MTRFVTKSALVVGCLLFFVVSFHAIEAQDAIDVPDLTTTGSNVFIPEELAGSGSPETTTEKPTESTKANEDPTTTTEEPKDPTPTIIYHGVALGNVFLGIIFGMLLSAVLFVAYKIWYDSRKNNANLRVY